MESRGLQVGGEDREVERRQEQMVEREDSWERWRRVRSGVENRWRSGGQVIESKRGMLLGKRHRYRQADIQTD